MNFWQFDVFGSLHSHSPGLQTVSIGLLVVDVVVVRFVIVGGGNVVVMGGGIVIALSIK